MKTSEAVAKRTCVLLVQKNMTQYRLCKNMAIHQNTMTNIMTAKNKSVNLNTVLKIARGLGVTASEFFDDSKFEDAELDID